MSENRMKPQHQWLGKKPQCIQDRMSPCASAANCSARICCPARHGQQTATSTLPPPCTIWVTYNEEDPLRRGVMSEYNPAYQTLHFSDASPMHFQSSSAYSDALHIGLCMLCNSTPPPASMPLHVLPPLVCLFVCLPLSPVHVLLVLFVCFPFRIVSIN